MTRKLTGYSAAHHPFYNAREEDVELLGTAPKKFKHKL